jgi:hypothetical protein
MLTLMIAIYKKRIAAAPSSRRVSSRKLLRQHMQTSKGDYTASHILPVLNPADKYDSTASALVDSKALSSDKTASIASCYTGSISEDQ